MKSLDFLDRRKEDIRRRIEEGWQSAKRGEIVDGDEVFELTANSKIWNVPLVEKFVVGA